MANKVFYITVLILAGAILCGTLIHIRGKPTVVAVNLEKFPKSIGGFSATEDAFSQAVYEELNADVNIYRHYNSEEKGKIDLYIGYYGTAKGGRTPHNPYACYPSSGWAIIEKGIIPLDIEGYSRVQKINYLLVKKGDIYNVVYHWYQSDGDKILATGVQRNIQRFLSQVFKNKNDGAFVRISAYTEKGKIEDTKNIIEPFVKKILLLLPSYWPEEKVLK